MATLEEKLCPVCFQEAMEGGKCQNCGYVLDKASVGENHLKPFSILNTKYLLDVYKRQVLNKAQEVFEDDAEFLPEFLKDADLIYKNGGGNGPFQVLSDQYWNDVDSLFAENVSHAWLCLLYTSRCV